MFPRVSRVKSGKQVYEYLRIVEAYRDQRGKNHQRVVANLGRIDLIRDDLDTLVDRLRPFCARGDYVRVKDIGNEESVTWGQILVVRKVWAELELDRIIRRLCQGRHDFDVAEHAFVLVASRLCAPTSEHGLARWLDSTYVCNSVGERFLPAWLPPEEVSPEQRVKVCWEWLQTWYRTLDAVYAHKTGVEQEIYLRLRDLFHLKVDLVFYDLTTLYFERREPKGELRRHGANKDGKPRNVQVLLGLVMVNGFPLATHVFAGNRAEKKTVPEVVADLRQRFGIGELILVADRGIDSPENRTFLGGLESCHYLFAHKGRRDAHGQEWLRRITGTWQDCGRGSRVQEVTHPEDGMRVLVVESDERKAYEQALRERSMARAQVHLEKVAQAVKTGRLKKTAAIAARAARALSRDKGLRYFSYRVNGDGHFVYQKDEQKLAAEILHEGRYILTTDHGQLSPQDAVHRYKELGDVEEEFRNLKDMIEGRPIYHKTDSRVCAHLFFAHLGLMVLRHLQRRLEEAELYMSARDALAAAKSLGVATLDINGEQHVLAAGAKRDCRRVLAALGVTNTQPPGTRSCSEPQKSSTRMAM